MSAMKPVERWAAVNEDGTLSYAFDHLSEEGARQCLNPGQRLTRVLITEGWMPIETAPKDGTPVDVWCVSESRKGFRLADATWNEKLQAWQGPAGFWTSVTHWMPTPAPPSEAARTEEG